MAQAPIPAIADTSRSIDPTQLSILNNNLNNNQITAALVSGKMDPKFATILLNQMNSNNVDSILFGDQTNDQTTGTDMFGMQGMIPGNLQGTNTMNNTDVFGASSFSNFNPQFEMSIYSTLIGKTVTAVNPLTGKEITEKVTSVKVQNGKVSLDLNGVTVPTENLIRVQ